jgi:putative FmdB family regulatory protein
MPIYEYECPSCGARFEKLRKMSERNESPRCAACGSNAVYVFSSPNLLSGGNKRPSKNFRSSEPVVGGTQITNCTFENSGIGISLPEGANVMMKGNKFKNVKTPVEFTKR